MLDIHAWPQVVALELENDLWIFVADYALFFAEYWISEGRLEGLIEDWFLSSNEINLSAVVGYSNP